jgi:hypothetical protein
MFPLAMDYAVRWREQLAITDISASASPIPAKMPVAVLFPVNAQRAW